MPRRFFFCFFLFLFLFSACSTGIGGNPATPTPTPTRKASAITPTDTPNVTASPSVPAQLDSCPAFGGSSCFTPYQLRLAYGVQSLIDRGFTGKGQTVVDIVSYGSPTVQQDMDMFDQQFGLPPITIQVMSPLGTVPFDPSNKDMLGWASETDLDVQIIHALAPDANIVVLTSPVDETEGTIGLPQFLQLEQYALSHHLGNIISQSWGASEVTLNNTAGQQEIQQWDTFYHQATTQQGMTFFTASGDNGATDYRDLQATQLSPNATTSFAADDPWVTTVGGTRLVHGSGDALSEVAWNSSGGGFSKFYSEPSYQQALPASAQALLINRRGVPDVAAEGDPASAMPIYFNGVWQPIGGTSAATPQWAAILAIGDQMAGHPLGFINAALYKLALSSAYSRDFHDITVGNNSVDSKGVSVPGYNAIQGWDPITGLGSPNAQNLLPDLIAALK